MTALKPRRTTPAALLILIGSAGGLFYSQTVASENGSSVGNSRRTAAGQRAIEQGYEANPSVQPPRSLRDRSNRTPFVQQEPAPLPAIALPAATTTSAPPRVVPRTFIAEPASSAPQLLAVDPRSLNPMRGSSASSNAASTTTSMPTKTMPLHPAPTIAPVITARRTAQVAAPVSTDTDETTELPFVQDFVAMQPSADPPAPQRREPAAPPTPQSAAPATINPAPIGERIPAPNPDDDQQMFAPLKLSGINEVTTSIATPGGGDLPRNLAALAQPAGPQDLAPPDEAVRVTAPFYSTPRVPDFTHRPLYFEERGLERNGRSIGILQPGLSAAHFFGTIPILPYKMGAQPPSRPVYTGNGIDPPSDHLSIRDRVRGVMAEAGVVLGLNYILP